MLARSGPRHAVGDRPGCDPRMRGLRRARRGVRAAGAGGWPGVHVPPRGAIGPELSVSFPAVTGRVVRLHARKGRNGPTIRDFERHAPATP